MSCEAQLAWKWLFTPTFFGGRLWPVHLVKLTWILACDLDSLVCKITSLCVQQSRFVTRWLTSRHTPTHTHTHRQHFDQLVWKARPDELKTPQVILIYNWQCDSETAAFLVTPTVSPSGAIVKALFVFIVLLCVVGWLLTTAVLSVCLVAAGGGRRRHAPWAALCREGRKYGIPNLAASDELAFALQTVIFYTLLTPLT